MPSPPEPERESDATLKVLDAGTGRGLFALALASLFPKASVTGIDLDEGRMPRNRAMASNLGLSNCDFQVRDVTTLSPGEDWDFILSTDNLEHLDDDAGQCRVFFGALKPGGRLLVHVPHLTRNLFGFKRENFMGIEGHVRPGYTQAGLRRLIEDAGFRVLREAYTYGWWETLANDLSYLITGGREKRKMLYAMCFPLLMLISQLGRWCTPRSGSGLLLLAEKAADQGSGGQ